jgi:hypothetical protein
LPETLPETFLPKEKFYNRPMDAPGVHGAAMPRPPPCIPGAVLISVLHIKPMEYQHFAIRHGPLQWRGPLMHPRPGLAYKTNEILECCFLTWPNVSHPRLGFAYKTNEILTFCFPTWPAISPPGRKMIRAGEQK